MLVPVEMGDRVVVVALALEHNRAGVLMQQPGILVIMVVPGFIVRHMLWEAVAVPEVSEILQQQTRQIEKVV